MVSSPSPLVNPTFRALPLTPATKPSDSEPILIPRPDRPRSGQRRTLAQARKYFEKHLAGFRDIGGQWVPKEAPVGNRAYRRAQRQRVRFA